jgi:cysteinyl-tRNA synthetase
MDDDLNVSAALASIFGNVKHINAFLTKGALDAGAAEKILAAFQQVDEVLNIFDFSKPPAADSAQVRELIQQREKARKEKNWTVADQLREKLQSLGVTVVDTKR